MVIRWMVLLFLAAGTQLPCFAWWFTPECESPISYSQYLRKGGDFWRWELITAGPDEGKYKPAYTVRVDFPGRCQGKYASPCRSLDSGKGVKEQVSPAACKSLVALASMKTVDDKLLKKPITREQWGELDPSQKSRWEPVTAGPDAYKGVYKQAGHSRINFGKYEGSYYPPTGHCGWDTVDCDPYLAKWLKKLIKYAR